MSDLVIPDYLNEDADTIQARMNELAPDGVSTIEGDMFYDATRPSAVESSRLQKIQLQNILKQARPQTATGTYLEYWGELKGVYKNAATVSSGYIQVTAAALSPISKGTVFGTPSTTEKESIKFQTLEDVVVDGTGVATISAECLTAGIVGNVEPNTITILFDSSITGIKSVTNPEKFTGGTDIEDEEHYRARVVASDQEENLSGADSDYEKWALEVDGCGYAYAIEEWNGPGTVKVLILDKNGQPATQVLIKAVKDYIYPDKLPGKNRGGKAPTGAVVTIDTPNTLSINVKANYTFTSGFDPETVLTNLKDEITDYLKEIKINGVVKYNSIYSIVGAYVRNAKGIDDFENLTVNGGIDNITLVDEVPAIGEVINA